MISDITTDWGGKKSSFLTIQEDQEKQQPQFILSNVTVTLIQSENLGSTTIIQCSIFITFTVSKEIMVNLLPLCVAIKLFSSALEAALLKADEIRMCM